jgi:hypothetical protein
MRVAGPARGQWFRRAPTSLRSTQSLTDGQGEGLAYCHRRPLRQRCSEFSPGLFLLFGHVFWVVLNELIPLIELPLHAPVRSKLSG